MKKRDLWIANNWQVIQWAAVFFAGIIVLNIARFVGYFISGDVGWYWAGWVALIVVMALFFTPVGRLMDKPWPPFRGRIRRLIQDLQNIGDENVA